MHLRNYVTFTETIENKQPELQTNGNYHNSTTKRMYTILLVCLPEYLATIYIITHTVTPHALYTIINNTELV